ncbi:hypothetical protein GYMLUDRAFT_178672 [Collybiopsis luxurians FD-317 M1]|uniref:Uncharacterized protein n=1 Tax=Collybiopsis luxurians FD-317 M1 TaxID=944289 RepID=A0A0D0CFE6_9AGAR|nr:hypothetical protein GYMLUDRAFT_178672 [Collybiopsis luxurians FD-317 M1]
MLPAGHGFRGGRLHPGNYANTQHNSCLINEVLKDPAVQLVACFIDAGLLAFQPKLHSFLSNLLEKILLNNPNIVSMFNGCCYGACHFNLHSTSTRKYKDFFNILFAMCAVYSSGEFDHMRGGHFIAWSLCIVSQFPAGSAIFILSAPVTHANTLIAAHKWCSSMAFFTLSGLGQWYQNGYMADKELKECASLMQLQAWKKQCEDLWEIGLELLHYD